MVQYTIDAQLVDSVLKGVLMENRSSVSIVCSRFEFGANDFTCALKNPNKNSFEIIIKQLAHGFTFKLTCGSIPSTNYEVPWL